MKIKVAAIINGIHLFFIVLSMIYILLRIIMIILVIKLDFVLYSRALEANLWTLGWTWDIIIGFVFILASSFYFQNKILPFILFLTTLVSCSIWWLMILVSQPLTLIEDTSLKGNYVIHKYSYPSSNDETTLVATVYKESYPLLYKETDKVRGVYFDEKDIETITLFNENHYAISDDGKIMFYGAFKVPMD